MSKEEKKKKKAKTKQPTGSAIPNQKALDAFQSQLSYLLGTQQTLTLRISVWAQHLSLDYSGKNRFSSLEICILLKKGSPGRNAQSIPQRAMALQPPGQGTDNGDRARPFQGAAGALGALSLAQRNPPWQWLKSGSGGGGLAVQLPSWASPARGRGETRR